MTHSKATNCSRSADPAYPLSEFYERTQTPMPRLEVVAKGDIPEPYRSLLVHEGDMTQTLERFHNQRISLRVLDKRLTADCLFREIVLVGDADQRLTEFGAIRIYLDRFDAEPKRQILACHRPLGGILQACRIEFVSRPTAFFRVRGDAMMHRALGSACDDWLFGRHNQLLNARNQTLAEVVEILPDALEHSSQTPLPHSHGGEAE